MGTSTRKQPRRVGRPSGAPVLRDRLIEVAAKEFAAHGFRGASVQKIARGAGATPAMVHYYFDNKRGLYRAMLEHTLGPVLAALQAGVQRMQTAQDPLESFLRVYMTELSEHPEIPALLLRDVLDPDAEMRDEFIDRFASRGAGMIKGILRDKIADGQLRDDLDVELAALSFLSMAAFPFLAAPVVERVFGAGRDAATIDRLASHTIALFYQGTGAAR